MKALIVVDVQRDFCEGGSLAVAGGEHVARKITWHIREYGDEYGLIVFTQDWHRADDHNDGHFAAEEPDYVNTWPVHCVAGTEGALLHPNLEVPLDVLAKVRIFRKGYGEAAYSGFEGKLAHFEGTTDGSLNDELLARGIDTVDVCGIATDYCVKATALDAVKFGYTTTVLGSLVAGVAPASAADALLEMYEAGVEIK